jgi:hypothetical protein
MGTNNIMEDTSSEISNNMGNEFNPLYDKWTMYAHLPHDTDWSIDSYKTLLEMKNLEECISLLEAIPEKMIQNCMLFMMKNDIKPTWEDPMNRNGGSFSFKVNTNNVYDTWKSLCYSVIGNTITKDLKMLNNITGITISPKRNFCIVKIWVNVSNMTNIKNIKNIPNLKIKEALFKKHTPDY